MQANLKWIAIALAICLKSNIVAADLELLKTNKRLEEKLKFVKALDMKKGNFSEALSVLDEEIIQSESYQQVIEKRIQKEREKFLQQELLSETASQSVYTIKLHIKKLLQQSYLDENAGIFPVLMGVQSFEDFTLRRYVAKKIVFKNARFLQELRIVADRYLSQKRQSRLLFQQLENLRTILKKQAQTLRIAQQQKFEAVQAIAKARDFTQQEVKRLTARYESLAQVEQDLKRQSAFKEKGVSILKWKGLLELPATGTVFFYDGEKNAAGFSVPLRGVFIQGNQGDLVSSVFPGKIVFAGFMKGFGRTIIVDHGSAVHSVYAHLDRFAVTFASLVSKGQTIGYMGDTESTKGVQLYFELRQNGISEDPANWFF